MARSGRKRRAEPRAITLTRTPLCASDSLFSGLVCHDALGASVARVSRRCFSIIAASSRFPSSSFCFSACAKGLGVGNGKRENRQMQKQADF